MKLGSKCWFCSLKYKSSSCIKSGDTRVVLNPESMSLERSEMNILVANIMGMLNDLPDVRQVIEHAIVWMAGEIERCPVPVMLLDAIAAELHHPFYDDRREIFRNYMEDALRLLPELGDYSFTNAFNRLGARVSNAA
jgi:hypothetical protein